MPPWFAQLVRRFSPRLLRLGVDGPRPLPCSGSGEPLLLVGREICLFLQVDATNVSSRHRSAFVALAVRRAAPFGDPDFDVLWTEDHASVWYWSKERVRALGGGSMRKRAEALFRGEIADSDVVELLDLKTAIADGEPISPGVEARVWRGGRVHASRWWPTAPDAGSWSAFARGTGIDASLTPPAAQPARIREHPLDKGTRPRFMPTAFGTKAPLAAGIAGTLALAMLTWQSASTARVAWQTHRVEQETEQLEAGMRRILVAREQADAARSRIDAVLALHAPASQIRLLGEIKRITPGTWELMAWNQPGPDVLEVSFRMPNADIAALVAAWEASPLLQDVVPGSGLGDVTLKARLTPIAARTK